MVELCVSAGKEFHVMRTTLKFVELVLTMCVLNLIVALMKIAM